MRRRIAAAVLLAGGLLLAACQGDGVSRALGAACREPGDCDEVCLPPSDAAPGGFCTRRCGAQAECPREAACVTIAGSACLYLCADDGDCDFLAESGGRGWVCRALPTPEGGTVNVCAGE